MCNYGYSDLTDSECSIDYVRSALGGVDLNSDSNLLISPSGSFLDDWEVPPSVRHRILDDVSELPWREFKFETQAQFVCKEKLNAVKERLHGRRVMISVGLESANDDIRRLCINKNLEWGVFLQSLERIKSFGFAVSVNVLVGAPFLGPMKQLLDTLQTIETLVNLGVDEIFIFPVNVKVGTLVGWLWKNGYYETPSLWSLIYLLTRVSPRALGRVSFAWHKQYYGTGSAVAKKVLSRPQFTFADERESTHVSTMLDQFLKERDVTSLRQIAATSVSFSKWLTSLSEECVIGDVRNVIGTMVDSVLGPRWKATHRDSLNVYLDEYDRHSRLWKSA
jgi:radical SAM enzyme (TIGR01210 family)